MPERRAVWREPVEAGVATAGLCVFALLAHRGGVLRAVSFCGLATAAAGIAWSVGATASPSALLGFGRLSRKVAVWAAIGCAIGLGYGVAYRVGYGRPALPGRLEGFVVVAALVGGVEELLYRGYVQGRVRRWGWLGAVAFAAASHAAYKTALFTLPPFEVDINYAFLGGATFLGGLVFGATRELSGSVLPPLAAHAVFDIIAYGDWAHAPWWVWS